MIDPVFSNLKKRRERNLSQYTKVCQTNTKHAGRCARKVEGEMGGPYEIGKSGGIPS